ncbi:aminodeoxychorismate synthase component I [candidate division KSB1 bacterium]|nr:aminodeoxychorismate synthase component I [candidate division KSB1 bacterium]
MSVKNLQNLKRIWENSHNNVLLYDFAQKCWLLFSDPVKIVIAKSIQSVIPVLKKTAYAVENHGLFAAGFIAYEAAPAFDACLQVKENTGFPHVWFGLYRTPQKINLSHAAKVIKFSSEWKSCLSENDYLSAIHQIKNYIARGETYQVNFTMRLKTGDLFDPLSLFLQLMHAQDSGYSALIRGDNYSIMSASPELFFRLDGENILSQPMKGTAPRGLWFKQDLEFAEALRASIKDRAENVMIVDMVRNDLGRIAKTGSVGVRSLYDIQKFATVWQMTSTVEAKTSAGLPEIFHAMFPPASITGAPKPRTMKIIAELEKEPRKIYTGCIGYYAPGRKAQFNVAIRTILTDHHRQISEYGVGGGIVWDSVPSAEYRECQTKARILSYSQPEFQLLETVLWIPPVGIFLQDEHLSRLSNSAKYFNFKFDLEEFRKNLADYTAGLRKSQCVIRICLSKDGVPHFESRPRGKNKRHRICLSRYPIDENNAFLYHKTTHRHLYDRLLNDHPGYDNVLLWNQKGEITESCIANVLFATQDGFITPPVRCGLLAGTYRSYMLKQGLLKEKVIRMDELELYPEFYLINSVRKMWKPDFIRPV